MKPIRCILFLLLLFFAPTVFAKEAFQKAPPPPDGYALIYMYRIKAGAGLRKPTILIDREEVSKLPNNAYTWFYVSAGSHSLQTKWGAFSDIPGLEMVVNLAPGETYYLQLESVSRQMGNQIKVYTAIKEIASDVALQDLQKTKKYFAATQQTTGATSTVTEETEEE
ncbi:MAG: DUF2846 domain-containing protein, partial [Deltaproteobacteria bacterium]|nr:DUF2846 domain-containing protein [Deltaproteobacteria bacterium]